MGLRTRPDRLDAPDKLRLDKWLWQARFFKTRSLATQMVERGRSASMARRVKKPATAVRTGDMLTFAQGAAIRVVRVTGAPRPGAGPARGGPQRMFDRA